MDLLKELLDLLATWDRASAEHIARANRLGNCRAGEVAAADGFTLQGCANDVRNIIAKAAQPADA